MKAKNKEKDMPKTAVDTVETKGAVATLGAFDMEVDSGAGLENLTKDDFAIPFLVILQSGSPQCKRGEQSVVGAKEGDVYNTVSGALYASVTVVPVAYQKAWVEWKPREIGGGLVKQHADPAILNETKNIEGKDVLPNGNIVVTTAYTYVLLVDMATGNYSPAVVAFQSTQLKKSKKWNSLMSGLKMDGKKGKFTPPMYSHLYTLSTVPEGNEKGSWSGWHVALGSQVVDPQLYTEAKAFSESVRSGLVQATPPTNPDVVFTDEDPPF